MMDTLAPGEVAVYLARPDLPRAAERKARYEALLSEEERARIARFRFEDDRDEHFLTRVLVRLALSRHRAVAPGGWRFRENDHGRPEIAPPCELRFNATNARALVGCAVAEGAEIGIDVEPRSRAEQILEVASTVFSDDELEGLRALGAEVGAGRTRGGTMGSVPRLGGAVGTAPSTTAEPAAGSGRGAGGTREAPALRHSPRKRAAPAVPEPARDRAIALWTLKEAYIKARGIGLGLPLRRMTMIFAPDGTARIVTDPDVDPDPSRWRFGRMDLEDHTLAIAVELGAHEPMVVRAPVTLL